MRMYGSAKQLAARAAMRPPIYLTEMAPAIVERGEGYVIVETDHPAWIALREKYSPAPIRPPQTPAQVAAYEQAFKDSEAAKLELFHSLWDELHTMRDPTPEKLALFVARIPCGTCQEHWRELDAAEPLDMSSDEAFFVGTVKRHDIVNARLGKPIFGLAAARELYGR